MTIDGAKFTVAQPWLWSTAGFGLFFNAAGDGAIALPAAGGVAANFSCQRQLDLWVVVGGHRRAYAQLAQAIGPPRAPPAAAFGYWQSRDAYRDRGELLAVARNFSALRLPVAVLVVDLGLPADPPYYRLDPARFPDAPGMVAAVRNLTGAAVIPNLKPTSIAARDCPACAGGGAADGEADDGRIDPTSPACRACAWQRRLRPQLYDRGIAGFWLDVDEATHFRAPLACGPAAHCGQSAAGLDWVRLFAEGALVDGGAPLILSRNMWGGAARWGAALWSSDILSSWTELRAQVSVGLAAGLSGFPLWTSDVGGFVGDPSPELAVRWHQFGSVCPIYRSHGARACNEPWCWGTQAQRAIAKSIALRQALRPYLAELAANTSVTGAPMMRPLWWEFPEALLEPALRAQLETTFMLGTRLLAAPVLEPGVESLEVALPGGASTRWTHHFSGRVYRGGTTARIPTPYDELCLLVRG